MLGREKADLAKIRKEGEIVQALAYLARRFSTEKHPGIESARPARRDPMFVPFKKGTFVYYWLYSVERVGSVLGLTKIGKHDWYRAGAEWLLEQQKEDGSWVNADDTFVAPEPPLPATCFALLFLKRSTRAVVTPSSPK
jgi:hypothetical protein